jgi:hypothetical protein
VQARRFREFLGKKLKLGNEKFEFTSDGEPRLNYIEPLTTPPAPSVPPFRFSIGEGARVGILNDYGLAINAQLIHWASAVTPCSVIDRTAAHALGASISRINNIITTMNAACTEQNILTAPGQRMKNFVGIDYNSFTSVMNAIGSQMTAMQAALP